MSAAPTRIPHSKPTLPSAEEWPQVTARLAPGWAADGPCLEQFQREAAHWLGHTEGVAVNSGTSALHLALLGVGVRPGDDVLVPAYCCAALLCAVELAGGRPVLVDCPPGGFNLSPEEALRRRTPRTRAVVVASLFGYPADIEPFLALGVPLIEDCAQSLGARRNGVPSGGRGQVAIGSFYATKVITTGQGGVVATSDPALLAEVHDRVEYDQRDDWKPRFNYRMGELPAAQGLWQLERLPRYLKRRREIAEYYAAELSPTQAERPGEPGTESIDFRFILRVPDADSAFIQLAERGVDAKRPVFRPLHRYAAANPGGAEFPGAESAHRQIVSLPIYPTLSDGEVERVAAAARRLARA